MKRRRWFQIHLSTAIVLMFVAGGFMGLNTIPFRVETFIDVDQRFQSFYYGWPCELCYSYTDRAHRIMYHAGPGSWSTEPKDLGLVYVLVNMAVCAGIMLVAGILIEWRIRRREAMSERSRRAED